MNLTVSAVLAVLVFGVFWLITQDWLGLFPRAVKRVVAICCAVILVAVSQLSPAAFQGGITQFVEWSQDRYKNLINTIVEQPSLPTYSDPPDPVMGEMRPIP